MDKNMSKTIGAIFYTDFHLDPTILNVCQEQLKKSFGGNIVSVSLKKSLDLGKNIVLQGAERSYPTMVKQILMGLEALTTDIVFFTEHDVLYPREHFDFVPLKDDIFYYNTNFWRWKYPSDLAITWNDMCSLSAMCCNRKLAIDHYQRRMKFIEEVGMDKFRSREPRQSRIWGYEPGSKRKRRGGFSDELHETWKSEIPLIDIRHSKTFSRPKVSLEEFKHPPDPNNWKEIQVSKIPGWENILNMFNIQS
jgi:hypothetical protein